ncbi:5-oxoprolinase/urea amidolyase family protein [Acidisoma sp. 7E03]
MSAGLLIRAAGPGCTLQDGGRHGWLRFGVTPAGPMDRLAFETVHRALGNPAGGTAIEIGLGGFEAVVEGAPLCFAIAGGRFVITVDGKPVPPAVLLRLETGAVLRIQPGAAGSWCYLAVAGRIDVPPMLGSTATHLRSGFGGLEGRALAGGDRLAIAEPRLPAEASGALDAPWLDRPAETIRVILGPQADYFPPKQIAAFLAGPWTLSTRRDRMAYFLEGPRLSHAEGFNIVSDGIAMGSVQVPGEGQPIVLMADRQPTGGYPKIATVIGPDLGRLAQARPGASFRFAAVTVEDAVAARVAEAAALAPSIPVQSLRRQEFSPAFLIDVSLTDEGETGAEMEEGTLTAAERLDLLFDATGWTLLRPVTALLLARGTVMGRPVLAAARDLTVADGAWTAADLQALAAAAEETDEPLVLLLGGGARTPEDAPTLAALHVTLAGRVQPSLALAFGPVFGPDALLTALATLTIIVAPSAYVALSGPAVLQRVTGQHLAGAEIGGVALHAAGGRLVEEAPHAVAALLRARQVLDMLPEARRAG